MSIRLVLCLAVLCFGTISAAVKKTAPCPQVLCRIGCNRTIDPKTKCPTCICPPAKDVRRKPPICLDIACLDYCQQIQDPETGCISCVCPPPDPISTGDCRTEGCPDGQECKMRVWGCENPPPFQPCDPVVEWQCQPGCVVIPCAIRCRYGLKHDDNGCQLCECLPNPCDLADCAPGYTCNPVLQPSGSYPPFIAHCEYACPWLGCKTCLGGNVLDEHGCRTCQCLDPCEGVACPDGLVCQAAPEGSDPRYQCVEQKDLCCPTPKPPQSDCSLIPLNNCQSCSKDCTTLKCGGSTRCCPDWQGCYGCREAEPC